MSGVFGEYVGRCENCDRLIFDRSVHYWAKLKYDAYLFCNDCVTVIEPKKGKRNGRKQSDRTAKEAPK